MRVKNSADEELLARYPFIKKPIEKSPPATPSPCSENEKSPPGVDREKSPLSTERDESPHHSAQRKLSPPLLSPKREVEEVCEKNYASTSASNASSAFMIHRQPMAINLYPTSQLRRLPQMAYAIACPPPPPPPGYPLRPPQLIPSPLAMHAYRPHPGHMHPVHMLLPTSAAFQYSRKRSLPDEYAAMRFAEPPAATAAASLNGRERHHFPSYTAMIAQAILSVSERKSTLGGIYDFIELHYKGLEKRVKGWRNCVRHNLSLNECFIKVGRSKCGRGNDWIIHPAYIESFMRGEYRKHRACVKEKFDMTWMNDLTAQAPPNTADRESADGGSEKKSPKLESDEHIEVVSDNELIRTFEQEPFERRLSPERLRFEFERARITSEARARDWINAHAQMAQFEPQAKQHEMFRPLECNCGCIDDVSPT